MSARRPTRRAAGLVAVVLGVGLAGCGRAPQGAVSAHEPATVATVDGRTEPVVRFDAEAVDQVSVRTVPVRREGVLLLVPHAALIYDEHGGTWVYTALEPGTYQRAAVAVDRSDSDWIWLTQGPTPGTAVVTVGAAEIYGAELGIAGGH